ncbi:hypothetical protein BKA64DRAFT_443813 [Cadophora sp. MPI-SDFR-AT-0126]|nr:hypothetical protein BKA64DRAFT_443813 [Leotiomycetes sp. MPI-SDFR-AT-0126]
MTATRPPDPTLVEAVFNHIALPPRLPGSQDDAIDKIERQLIDRLLGATNQLAESLTDSELVPLRRSLEVAKRVNANGRLTKSSLLTAFTELEATDFIVAHVREQNAAVIIRRQQSNSHGQEVIFEAFEVSALSDAVLATKSALQWDFPGNAVAIPLSTFQDINFQEQVATFLERTSLESIKCFGVQAQKAGTSAYESRQTVNPTAITELLMTILSGHGRREFPTLTRKRVRDEASYSPGGDTPWRRCPLWLALRVAIQRHLCLTVDSYFGRHLYKILICLVHSQLLDDCPLIDSIGQTYQKSFELSEHLKTKLCRRILKLQNEKDQYNTEQKGKFQRLFSGVEQIFKISIESAKARIETAFEKFKGPKCSVEKLHHKAQWHALSLTLKNSGPYLGGLMGVTGLRNPPPPLSFSLPEDYQFASASKTRAHIFNNRYVQLSIVEEEAIGNALSMQLSPLRNPEIPRNERIDNISSRILKYLDDVHDAYEGIPEQQSIMLLNVMDLWREMDLCATESYPLLKDYAPGFPMEILDVLHLARRRDMLRLQKIRDHLRARHADATHVDLTIFANPQEHCFAVRYYNESPDSRALQHLHQAIEAKGNRMREEKERELRSRRLRFEALKKQEAEITKCNDTLRMFGTIVIEEHISSKCNKCRLVNEIRRFYIRGHERPLPDDPIQAKVAVFELGCPEAFSLYRNTTWHILSTLALLKQVPTFKPSAFLDQYLEGLGFDTNNMSTEFCIASTKKPWPKTHYFTNLFPVGLDDICHPNGMNFEYFDKSLGVWAGRAKLTPSFAHHCRMVIPATSPFASLFRTTLKQRSSYEIIASQTKCHPGLNHNEFLAFQGLFSGDVRRWPQILIELASSNVNFGTEAARVLLSYLTLHVGPQASDNKFGIIHAAFDDQSFCEQLLRQLHQRLDAISSNCRETNCMESLITIGLRLFELGSTTFQAADFLERARTVTIEWMASLKCEMLQARDTATSLKYSEYALWAALLCRRTFCIYLDRQTELEPQVVCSFIESSIHLQDNIIGDPSKLETSLKVAYIRDRKMLSDLRWLLRDSVESNQDSVMSLVSRILTAMDGTQALNIYGLEFLPHPDASWIRMHIAATSRTCQQDIHFHFLEGILLVMGKPVGKLPPDWRRSVVMQELFGNQVLLTRQSEMLGMTYKLLHPIYGHYVHLGYRGKDLIVRACFGNTVLEHIPRRIFGNLESCDLPAFLVDNCTHWMNLQTGFIEIRPKGRDWISNHGNWYLDYRRREAKRAYPSPSTSPRFDTLIDPHSRLFGQIAKIFQNFEDPQYLAVWQPVSGRLTVHLTRLELLFYVNSRGLLQCPQLNSEIDPVQDMGTWHGLLSKLVLREVGKEKDQGKDTWSSISLRQRTVLVCMGAFEYWREGPHLRLTAKTGNTYGRFVINETLGRLECAAELRLLCLKAALHAYTSCPIPDALTGRTGTEEAIHCLKSGYCQPWTPLTINPYHLLTSIAKLTPRREYYPANLRVLQTSYWDDNLTTTIQHDAYKSIVDSILRKSCRLSSFSPESVDLPLLDPVADTHLIQRSHLRRNTYQRPMPCISWLNSSEDNVYDARDHLVPSQSRTNVLECVKLLLTWPSQLPTTQDLIGMIQQWGDLEGCDQSFDRILLTDMLDLNWTTDWGPLVNFCRDAGRHDVYRLTFLLSTISFGEHVNMDAVRCLIAFSVLEKLKSLTYPSCSTYVKFKEREKPRVDDILDWLKPYRRPYSVQEKSSAGTVSSHAARLLLIDLELKYKREQERDEKALAKFLLDQWPCQKLNIDGFTQGARIYLEQALSSMQPKWLQLYRNLELSKYLAQAQRILDCHRSENLELETSVVKTQEQEIYAVPRRESEIFSLGMKLIQLLPYDSEKLEENSVHLGNSISTKTPLNNCQALVRGGDLQPPSSAIQELQKIIASTFQSRSDIRQEYSDDLTRSSQALQIAEAEPHQEPGPVDLGTLATAIQDGEEEVKKQSGRIHQMLENSDPDQTYWQKQGVLWPSSGPVSMLETLRSTSPFVLPKHVRDQLVRYALSITSLQRLLRVENALRKNNTQRLKDELKNTGHSNWNPSENPDWLLLEIDANLLIRPGQIEVALATIEPESSMNSVLQMNMGQGKTSCIIPMVASVLADGRNLMRVIVPKSLLLQTAQLLHIRLGGLIGREIVHVPFSRKTPTDAGQIGIFRQLHDNVRKSSGIIIALPEHLLSFKLSGLQRLSDGKIVDAKAMIETQSWLHRYARDVIDECDSILALRTQLIYPSGTQKVVDGHPMRWEIVQILLCRVNGHLENLQLQYPQSIEVLRRDQGGFPIIYFLRQDVETELISRLVEDIFHGRTSIFPPDCTNSDRNAIKLFISETKVTPELSGYIKYMFKDKPTLKQAVYLLRGLLVHRILLMVLKKRWNVQYGLHPSRDPIAVPFHAKGRPSDQAEWGHPDVAISLTCLAFYYSGLGQVHLRQTLEHISQVEEPSQVFSYIMQSSRLPDSLREWTAINIDDKGQLHEIWRLVRHSIDVIGYFLNSFVFPRHAKQFEVKLQASGWDLPLYERPLSLDHPTARTTGFSGTNDCKRMLPLTVKQEDLPGLVHTNAEVLTYLLEKRNRRFFPAAHRGRHISEFQLLQMVRNLRIRILIDAGAQILEMDNLTLVKAWLSIAPEAKAAIFFDSKGAPVVVYRNNYSNQIPLAASTFADDLSECLVYIDEAHTRGTDLKLPVEACGALTLGLGQTKDHTVQAAMRLRQLGTTQSIVFFAPPEVCQSINDLRTRDRRGLPIDSHDVVCWLLEQTCRGLEIVQPLYHSQGMDFCRRIQASYEFSKFLEDPGNRLSYLTCLCQVEQQTLEQLYHPGAKLKLASTLVKTFHPQLKRFMNRLNEVRKSFQDTGDAVHSSALQEVEQEREVAHEVEAVREIQKPVHYDALKFPGLHRDIANFTTTGKMVPDSDAWELGFSALRKFAIGKRYGVSCEGTSGRLYVSKEFMNTVNVPLAKKAYENFQRNVNWVLWSSSAECAILVNPEEAEELLLLIKTVPAPAAHILTYAAPVNRKMSHFNSFSFYAVPSLPLEWEAPSWLSIEVGLFAGRLYFAYHEYAAVLAFLGVREKGRRIEEASSDDDGTEVKTFAKRPLAFLQDWLALKRRGQDFSETPMGYVAQGKPLLKSHHFFREHENESYRNPAPEINATYVEAAPEEQGNVEVYYDEIEQEPVHPDEVDQVDDADEADVE